MNFRLGCGNTPVSKGLACLFGLALLTHAHSLSHASDQFPPTVRTEVNPIWEINGSVVDQDGQGISGAIVRRSVWGRYQVFAKNKNPFDADARCDRSGKYRGIECGEQNSLTAFAKGFAPTCVGPPEGNELKIKLDRGRTIQGRVLLPSGEPAVGVEVTPVSWSFRKSTAELSKYSESDLAGRSHLTLRHSAFFEFGKDLRVKTNSNGEFSLSQMPTEARVHLSVRPKGFREDVIVVRPEVDYVGKDYPSQILRDNEFEFEVNTCSLLKLKGVDAETGQPVKIASVTIEGKMSEISNSYIFRYAEIFDESSITISIGEFEQGCFVWVAPVNSKRLLGYRIALPANSKDTVFEQTIEFRRGKVVKGKVVGETDQSPIPNVSVMWRNADMKDVTEDGDFVPFETKTERDGTFEFCVPDRDGILGVIGKVKNYQFVTNWNEGTSIFEKFGLGHLLERYTRSLMQGELDDLDPFEFRLLPSFQINVSVVDRNGRPSPNAVLQFSTSTSPLFASDSYRPIPMTKVTDEAGKLKLEDWYGDAFQVGKAKRMLSHPDLNMKPKHFKFQLDWMFGRGYPTMISAFAVGGLQQGAGIVPMPESTAESSISLAIALDEPATVVGRVVGYDGNPVQRIDVTASVGGGRHRRVGQTWKTTTRDDGYFKVTGLPVGGSLVWQLDQDRVKTKNEGRIELKHDPLQFGVTVNAETVVVLDYSRLAEPLPEIDITGDSDDEILAKFSTYAKQCRDRIPKYEDAPPELSSIDSSNDPVPRYLDRVGEKLTAAIKDLIRKRNDLEFEYRLFEAIPNATNSSFQLGGGAFNEFVRDRVMSKHLGNPGAQQAIVMYAFTNRGWLITGEVDPAWAKVLNESPFDSTKASVAVALGRQHAVSMLSRCYSNASEDKFEFAYNKTKNFLSYVKPSLIEIEQGEKDSAGAFVRKMFRDEIEGKMNHMEEYAKKPSLKGSPKIDQARYLKAAKLLNKYIGD